MNISNSRWVTVSDTYKKETLQATIYNSLSSTGNHSSIIRNLSRIIETIITANPEAGCWTKAVSKKSEQTSDSTKGKYIESVSVLREQYLRAYTK